jgi:mevalonate kinase
MPAITATAPGKIILFGEHAVVYGRPAIAVPVLQVRARAIVTAQPAATFSRVVIQAPNIALEANLDELPEDHPLAAAILGVAHTVGITHLPACTVRISSTIPVASGLGSGAAVSVAVVRAFSAFLGHPLPDEMVSKLAFEVEKIHHGTPSGIDNTVITYSMPVYFVRGEPIKTLRLTKPFTILIGDTGISSPTSVTVGDVRHAWETSPEYYEKIFDRIGKTVQSAQKDIEAGDLPGLGKLMTDNHHALQELDVSSPDLDQLVEAACTEGAWGAKLSGGGRGGNMIALVEEDRAQIVAEALIAAGAKRVITTEVKPKGVPI